MTTTIGSVIIEPAVPPEFWVDRTPLKNPERGHHDFRVRNHVTEDVAMQADGTLGVVGESVTQITPMADHNGDLQYNALGFLELLFDSWSEHLENLGLGHTVTAVLTYVDEIDGIQRIVIPKQHLHALIEAYRVLPGVSETYAFLGQFVQEARLLWPDGTASTFAEATASA